MVDRKKLDAACGDTKRFLTTIRALSRVSSPNQGRLKQAVKALQNHSAIVADLIQKG